MEGEWMEGEAAARARDGAIDLPQLLRAVARRKRWIIIPTVAAFLIALAFVTALPPRYTGVAKVLLENQESYYTRPDKAAPEQAPTLDPEAVQSQAETITSPDLAHKAIAQLGLVDRPEFNQAAATDPVSMALSLLGLGGSAANRSGEAPIVDKFLSRLSAFPVAKTRVLQIEFVSQDPELAARGANVVAQLFLEQQENAKKNEAKAAGAWLAAKIEDLRGKVAETDAKAENFRAQSGLLASSNNMTVPGQQLSDLNTQLASARSAQSASLAKAQILRGMIRDGQINDVPDLAKDESLRRYAEQRVALKAQIAQESRTLLPGHPHMKELAAQLAGLDAEIRVAAEKAARGLENDARLAAAQVETLKATLAAQSKTVASGNADEVQLRALELDAKAARDQLESYLQKYREAIARDADNAAPADARVISVAAPPRSPTFPKKIETLLLGTLAGLLLSTGVVVSQALLSGRAGEAIVAGEPAVGRREDELYAAPDEAIAPAEVPIDAGDELAGDFRSVEAVADYLASLAAPGAALLTLVAGERSGDSLSIALAMARDLSRRGRAILVDLSQTPQWLADSLHREGEEIDRALPGLGDLEAGEATLAEIIHRDLGSSLDVIPAGRGEASSEGLHNVLEAFAASYAFVILHAADWRSDPALAALDHVHKAILVAPASRLREAIVQARRAMGAADDDVLGLIVAPDRSRVERAA